MSSVLRDAFRIPRGTLSWIRLDIVTLRHHFGKPSGLGASFWLLPEALRFFYFLYAASPAFGSDRSSSLSSEFFGTFPSNQVCWYFRKRKVLVRLTLNFKRYIDKL